MPLAAKLRSLLERSATPFEVIHHKADHTARQTAWDTHTPPEAFAKTVFVQVDGRHAMAVLPAADELDVDKLRRGLGARSVELETESEFEHLCPDCELGAAPPFGALYDLPLYASPRLAKSGTITFNGGSHRDAVRMKYGDYERLAGPEVLPLARKD